MNKYTLKTAIYFVIISLIMSGFIYPQDEPIPQFYGVYMVVDGNLIELGETEKSKTVALQFTISYSAVGLKELSSRDWLNSNNIYFIVYGDMVNNPFTLSKISYMKTMKRPAESMEQIGKPNLKYITENVEMNMISEDIQLRKAPISGLNGAIKYVPAKPINEGAYAFHDGVLSLEHMMEFSVWIDDLVGILFIAFNSESINL